MIAKAFGTIFLLFTYFFSCFAEAEEAHEEAWVAYATENYFSVLEVTIESVHTFSTRPIVVVALNADLPFSTEKYPRLIKKRIDVDLENRSPYVYKPLAILEANVENGIYVDADAILNKGCDALFEYCKEAVEYPLCPAHEQEAWVSPHTMEFLGVSERSMHYVHACVIVFSEQSKLFINEWCNVCLEHPFLGVPCWDESLLNVLLWKKGAKNQLLTIDPYNAYLDRYLELNKEEMAKSPYSYWYIFHGNKYAERGWRMLQQLKDKHL